MEAAAQRFFNAPSFAVVGASQNTNKFGYKILSWYHDHSLSVTPINPKAQSISLSTKSYDTVPSVSALSDPAHTSVSFVTPPPVTQKGLEEAKAAGVTSVWLQPGAFDEGVMQYAKDNFESAVGGEDPASRGSRGWCVLVDGDRYLKAAGTRSREQHL